MYRWNIIKNIAAEIGSAATISPNIDKIHMAVSPNITQYELFPAPEPAVTALCISVL